MFFFGLGGSESCAGVNCDGFKTRDWLSLVQRLNMTGEDLRHHTRKTIPLPVSVLSTDRKQRFHIKVLIARLC